MELRVALALGVGRARRAGPCSFFFFNDTATTEIYTLSLHDALPICARDRGCTDKGDLADEDLSTLRHHSCVHFDDGGRLLWAALHPNQTAPIIKVNAAMVPKRTKEIGRAHV